MAPGLLKVRSVQVGYVEPSGEHTPAGGLYDRYHLCQRAANSTKAAHAVGSTASAARVVSFESRTWTLAGAAATSTH